MKLSATRLFGFMMILIASTLMAQTKPALPLEPLLGAWKGEGKVMGMAARQVMTWEPALGGQFVRLTFRSELQTQGGVQLFEGHAYYKSLGDGKFEGTWFDSQGARHPIAATFADKTLTSDWGTEQTTLGRTIYRMADANHIEIVDSVRGKDGVWKEFGRSALARQ